MIEEHLDQIRLEVQYLRESLRLCRDRLESIEQENIYLRNQVDTLLRIVANDDKQEGSNH